MPRECEEKKFIHSKLQLVSQEGDGLVYHLMKLLNSEGAGRDEIWLRGYLKSGWLLCFREGLDYKGRQCSGTQ